MRVTRATEIEHVYRDIGERLWWALFAYTGDREMARDAAAEAFARALAAPDPIRDAAAWVWSVAFKVATASLRAPRESSEAEVSYEMDERALDVTHALRRLSERQRAVTVLFYLDDRPTREIARLLGMTPATVAVHLHRARRRLRTILGDEDA
jgi:RNA polymerase sigma factor (sigma-70 family)